MDNGSDITWQPVQIRLRDLHPWERNPRQMSKRAAERLLRSWREFGQVQTIAIGPGGEVYDGHQTDEGDVAFDPFLGSGTTLVACERLGRLGRGVEIEPKYVAVALERLSDMGLEPELVNAPEVNCGRG